MAYLLRLVGLLSVALLVSCDRSPPKHIHDACAIYQERPDWLAVGKRVRKRWGTPLGLQLAIIYTESRFNPEARPKREFLHLFNKSSARGYAQALDAVWRRYVHATGQLAADRTSFADASDFIGWYTHRTKKRFAIPFQDAKEHYLAFHEGWGGYARRSYRGQFWLQRVARKTQKQALLYNRQLLHCHLR
jgi:hypothetical protein